MASLIVVRKPPCWWCDKPGNRLVRWTSLDRFTSVVWEDDCLPRGIDKAGLYRWPELTADQLSDKLVDSGE